MGSLNLNDIRLPYVIKDVVLFSPGNHNGLEYTQDAIRYAFSNTDWNERTTSLYLDHEDEFTEDPRTGEKVLVRGASVRNWAGEVKNQRFVNGDIRGDLYILDRDTAVKLAYGAHFGISPRGKARRDGRYSNRTSEVLVENYSIVVNPAIKTAYINGEDGSLVPLDDNIVYYSMMAEENSEGLSMRKDTMDAEQLKEELAKTMRDALTASMADMNSKVTKLAEDVAKMKKAPEEEEKEMKAKKKDEEVPEEEPEKEEMKCKPKKEDEEEEMSDMISKMTPENLASWQELVRKYGIKGAKEKMGKKADDEKDAKMAELESRVKELSEKMKAPAEKKAAEIEVTSGPAIEQMSQRELDIRFIGYLQGMNGMPDTSEQKLKEEGFSA